MDLYQVLHMLKARKWIASSIFIATVMATMAISLLLPSQYTATATLVVDFKSLDPVSGVLMPAQLLPGYLATQMDILKSQNVALKVVNSLKLASVPSAKEQFMDDTGGRGSIEHWLAALLLKKLKVQPARESSVVEINFTATDPLFAATVANTFAQAYMATNLELRVDPARQTAEWFNERSKSLRTQLEDSQGRLSTYQQEKGIISAEERLDVETARLDQLNAQLSQAQAQTADAVSRQLQAKDFLKRRASPDALPDVLANPLVQSLKGELARRQAQFKELASRRGHNHPEYQALVAEVSDLETRMHAEIARVMDGIHNNALLAEQRQTELRNALHAQKLKVLKLKQERDELAVLARETDSAQKSFDLANQRLSLTSLESQSSQTNIAVLNPAVEPLEPSSPRLLLNFILSCFLGAGLGVVVALVVEHFDQRVRRAADVPKRLGLTLLATLPRPGTLKIVGAQV